MRLPSRVRVVEVGPRDGLQNESFLVTTSQKCQLINRLVAAGLSSVEVGSFVSPKWVPQMADTGDLLGSLERIPSVNYSVLVPNEKGLRSALAAGVKEVAVFAAASETFSRKNINCSVDESLNRYAPVIARARDAGVKVRGYVSCVLGCPYEGPVGPHAVAAVSGKLFEMGCYEVSLGDTIGVGTPLAAQCMVRAAAEVVPLEHLAVHYHDTWGQGLANIYASLELGVSVIDSSVAGLGGCPYAVGAAGNVATEDVIYMLDGLGVTSGVNLKEVVAAAEFISGILGRPPASRVARAFGAQGAR